jgi:hypothetical protein
VDRDAEEDGDQSESGGDEEERDSLPVDEMGQMASVADPRRVAEVQASTDHLREVEEQDRCRCQREERAPL